MKRKIFLLLAAAVLALSSCKYSNSSKSSAVHNDPFDTSLLSVEELEEPNVTMDIYWPFEQNVAAGDLYAREAIDAFEKKFGGKVTVNVIGFNAGIEVMQRNLASGDVSDLLFVDGNITFPKYALYSYITPITDFVKYDIGSKWLDQASMENFKFDGEYYGFTNYIVNQPYIIAYDKAPFVDSNLPTPVELYEAGEWTWDKFLEYVDFFTSDTNLDGKIDRWGLGPRYKNQNFGYAGGAMPIIELGNGLLQSNFDTPVMRQYFDFVRKLQRIQSRSATNDGWLGAGGVMYSEAGLAQIGLVDTEDGKKADPNHDFVPIPSIDGSLPTTPVWDTALVIPNGSRNPQGAAVLAAMIMETKERRVNEENVKMYTPEQLARYDEMMTSIVPQRKGNDVYTGVTTNYGDGEALNGSPPATIIETYRDVVDSEVAAFNKIFEDD